MRERCARDEAVAPADSGDYRAAQGLKLPMADDLRASGLAEEADLLAEAAPELAAEAFEHDGAEAP